MTFKHGEIVSYPNSNLPMQVIYDASTPTETTLCTIIQNKKIHKMMISTEKLVRALVN